MCHRRSRIAWKTLSGNRLRSRSASATLGLTRIDVARGDVAKQVADAEAMAIKDQDEELMNAVTAMVTIVEGH